MIGDQDRFGAGTPERPFAWRSNAWFALTTLTIIYAINIADRFVVSTLLEAIKAEFRLSDSAIGFLTGVSLAIFYVTAGLPLGALADRANRKKMVAISVAIWSLMTIMCGLSVTYWQMLLMRIGVGIGEAGATPPSHSLLSDKFGPRSRAFALSVFGLGASVGAYLGASGAGYLNDHFGWRPALIVFGVAGLPFAALCWLIREPSRGQDEARAVDRSEGATLMATITYMLADRALVHIMVGATVVTFWGWGILWWTPAFLTRSFALTTGQAGSLLGPMHGIGGGIIMLLTIAIMAWLKQRPQSWVPSFVAWTTLLGAVPSTALFFATDVRIATAMLWIFVPVIYIYIGPTSALVQNRFPPEMRAKGCAILLFVANIANLAIAPQLIGVLSDLVGTHIARPTESLRYVLLGCSFSGIWAAYHYWMAARAMKDRGELSRTEPQSLNSPA